MLQFILGAIGVVALSEISKKGKMPKMAHGGKIDYEKVKKADEIYREHNRERIKKGIEEFSQESVDLWNEKYDDRLNKLNLTYDEKVKLNPKNWYAKGGGVGKLKTKNGVEYTYFEDINPISKKSSFFYRIKGATFGGMKFTYVSDVKLSDDEIEKVAKQG